MKAVHGVRGGASLTEIVDITIMGVSAFRQVASVNVAELKRRDFKIKYQGTKHFTLKSYLAICILKCMDTTELLLLSVGYADNLASLPIRLCKNFIL